MGIPEWLAFAALLTTIAFGGGGVIWKLGNNKTEIIEKLSSDKTEVRTELDTIRMAAFVEYKELRHEISDLVAKAYRELAEGPRALREHVNAVEIWMRDHLLPRKEYERDQDQVLKAVERLTETMENRFASLDRKLEDRNA